MLVVVLLGCREPVAYRPLPSAMPAEASTVVRECHAADERSALVACHSFRLRDGAPSTNETACLEHWQNGRHVACVEALERARADSLLGSYLDAAVRLPDAGPWP